MTDPGQVGTRKLCGEYGYSRRSPLHPGWRTTHDFAAVENNYDMLRKYLLQHNLFRAPIIDITSGQAGVLCVDLLLVGDGYVEAEVGRLTYQVEGYRDAREDFSEGERCLV